MNREFPISQMAVHAEKPKRTQEELRVVLAEKLKSQKPVLENAIREYRQALAEGMFDDQDGEREGLGAKRKEEMQKRIETILSGAEKMKAKLDSNEILPQFQNDLSATYTHPDGRQENIALSFEQKFQEFLDLYQKTGIDLPADFEDSIQNIWQNNQAEMQQAIQEKGFDEILIIPANIPLPELSEKMKMENGYYDWIKSNSNIGNLAGIPLDSQNGDKPRIILVHKTQNLKDRPELEQTLGIKGQDAKQDETLTLEDYLVFQRKYFEENQKHLDESGATWLATKSGSRLVRSDWYPVDRRLYVHADELTYSFGNLGVRPARCFF